MRWIPPAIAALLTAFASPAAPQSLYDGNSQYDTGDGLNAACSGTAQTHDGNFFSATGVDTLWVHFWSVIVDGATTGCRLHGITSQDDGATYPTLMRRSYASFNGSLLDIDQYAGLTEVRPGAAILISRIRITNTDSSPHLVNAYAYQDPDMCAQTSNNSVIGIITRAGNIQHQITDIACTETLYIQAYGADGDRVDSYGQVLFEVLNARADYTRNPFSPAGNFGPGDATTAFQWKDRTIQPGASLECVVAFGHEAVPGECAPAAVIPYGTASSGATLGGLAPIIGNALEWSLHGGAPNQPGAVLLGTQQLSVPVCGLTLLVNPDLLTEAFTLDASGNAFRYYPVPYTVLNACGASLFGQAIYLDPTSTACIPVATTNGATFSFGL